MNTQAANVAGATAVVTELAAALNVPGSMDLKWAMDRVLANGSSLSVEFIDAGANNTGYFNNLCYASTVDLESEGGEASMYYGVDTHGRVVLILPIVDGKNIVLFQRYTGHDSVWVNNVPAGMDALFARMGWDGGMLGTQVADAIGSAGLGHIGQDLARFATMLNK